MVGKLHGPDTSYKAMDEIMKCKIEYFVQIFMHHYGGFKVLKSSLVASPYACYHLHAIMLHFDPYRPC